jgi:hypothetical protein
LTSDTYVSRIDCDRLLHEAIKQSPAVLPGCAAVEPEGEFIEAVIQVASSHSALVSAEKPSLE